MIVDPAATPQHKLYKMLIGSVVPRPIAIRLDAFRPKGQRNLAPFSFFNAVCGDPPVVCFSTSFREPRKDTYVNVKATRRIRGQHRQRGDRRADEPVLPATIRYGADEFEISGLTPVAERSGARRRASLNRT